MSVIELASWAAALFDQHIPFVAYVVGALAIVYLNFRLFYDNLDLGDEGGAEG